MNLSVRDYVHTMAGCEHILPASLPVSEAASCGHSHIILGGIQGNDENLSPSKSDQQDIGETITQFESLGMVK